MPQYLLYGVNGSWIKGVGGIFVSYIENCIKSCLYCQETLLWDKVHNIPCELVHDKLDEICKSHIVVRRVCKSKLFKHHRVTYYQCHRGGKKRPRKKTKGEDVSTSTSRRERKSMKCQCGFRIKVVVPFGNKKYSTTSESCMEAQIFVHSKHSGHNPGTEVDKCSYPCIQWSFLLQQRI